jgi:hypothetical protein
VHAADLSGDGAAQVEAVLDDAVRVTEEGHIGDADDRGALDLRGGAAAASAGGTPSVTITYATERPSPVQRG